jgi:predicted lipoprotein
MVRAAAIGLSEDKDGSRNARIGPEHTGRELNDGIGFVLFNENLTQLPVGR